MACEQSTNWAVKAQANDNSVLQNETKSRRKLYHIIRMAFAIFKNTSGQNSSSKCGYFEAKLYCSSYGDRKSNFWTDCIICRSSEFQDKNFLFFICHNHSDIRNQFTSETTQRPHLVLFSWTVIAIKRISIS